MYIGMQRVAGRLSQNGVNRTAHRQFEELRLLFRIISPLLLLSCAVSSALTLIAPVQVGLIIAKSQEAKWFDSDMRYTKVGDGKSSFPTLARRHNTSIEPA